MKPTIFAVEDDDAFAKFLAKSLQIGGYELIGRASAGEDALQQIALLHPDLVLMDMNLSGQLDGIDTAERIRAQFTLPVIFLTASDDESHLHRAKHAEPFGYLAKPFRQQDLVSAIEIAAYKHQIERKLKQREAWLATTLRCAGDGVVVTDAVGKVEFINSIAARIFGIQEADAVGRKFSEVVCLKSRLTGATAGDLVQLAILQGATMDIGTDLSVAGALPDEPELEGEISLSEVAGVTVGTVFTFRDTTIRRHQEEQHRQGLRKRAITQLAGAISTELKEARQKVFAGAQQLLRNVAPGDPVHLAVDTLKLQYEETMSRLQRQLAELQRKTTSSPRALDLNALLAGVCRDLRLELPRSVELTIRPSPALCEVVADPAQLKKALGDLILHSLDFLPQGGQISLATRTCGLEGRGRTARVDRYVRLTIAATSAEQSEEAQSEELDLLDPFSANSSSEKLDLRLFGVHGVIAEARGSISVRGRPGQDLTFEIVLPQRADRLSDGDDLQSVAAAVGHSAQPESEPGTVLVIEADNDIRALLLNGLEAAGIESLGARDPQEALAWLDLYAAPLGLLIASLEMPEMSALALAEQMAQRHPRLRALFITNAAIDPVLQAEWKHRGHFLERPFHLKDLLGIVNEMLLPGSVTTSSCAQASALLGHSLVE